MIFNSEPKNWQELQIYVGQLFEEYGFKIEISKTVDLVMANKYMPYSNRLFPYWEPYGSKMPKKGGTINWNNQQLLYLTFSPICRLDPGDDNYQLGGFERTYPIIIPDIDINILGNIEINNGREYFDFVELNKERAFEYFKKLYRE